MKSPLSGLILFVVWAFASVGAHANPPFQLADVEYINGFTGSKEAKALLAEQGFVVTGQQFTQMFAAYLKLDESKPWLPNFITEDRAWQAYHVMLEEGLRQLEEQQAGVLRRFSAQLVGQAGAKSKKAGDAYWDLAAFAAVGLTLQDGNSAETLSADCARRPGNPTRDRQGHGAVEAAVLRVADRSGAFSCGESLQQEPRTPRLLRRSPVVCAVLLPSEEFCRNRTGHPSGPAG